MADLRKENPAETAEHEHAASPGHENGGGAGPALATRPRRDRRVARAVFAVGGVLVVVTVVAVVVASIGGDGHKTAGTAPPEWSANGSSWPAFGHDLANTRATEQSPINAGNVAQLKTKWSFAFSGSGAFGAFASTPIIAANTLYRRT